MTIIPLGERLWRWVVWQGECWVYTRQPGERYPKLAVTVNGKKKPIPVHRVSWELNVGRIPDGLCVCHRCDNMRCVRPTHLFLATSVENTADKVQKNRQATGERLNSKLTPDDVRLIRKLYAAGGVYMKDLAARFGVTDSCIAFVTTRKSWKHIA